MEAARDLVMEKVREIQTISHLHCRDAPLSNHCMLCICGRSRNTSGPEFLNRLTEGVIFEPLSNDKLREVVDIQMKSIISSVANKGMSLSISDATLDVILSESYNPVSTEQVPLYSFFFGMIRPAFLIIVII